MGDHFVLIMDRLVTESTLEAAIQSRSKSQNGDVSTSAELGTELFLQKVKYVDNPSPRGLVQCRICHDEDEDLNMEAPCSCCGSLKYAHRKCVQRWCDEKGDTTCEICHQQFKPGYRAPAHLIQCGGVPMNFRNWEFSHEGSNSPRFAEFNFFDSDDDDHSYFSERSMTCCRSVAVIFMVLLLLRQTLPIIISGLEDFSFILITAAGIVLPVCIMARVLTAIQRRLQQQVLPDCPRTSEEHGQLALQPQRQPGPTLIDMH